LKRTCRPFEHAIGDVHGVLLVRHHDALLDREAVDRYTHTGSPSSSRNSARCSVRRRIRAGDLVLVAEPDDALARQAHALEQVIEQHHASERGPASEATSMP
jgi:hypothetical protein